MNRIAEYLKQTHGTRFELLRHFIGTMFESDLVTTPDEWKKAAVGLLAALVSLGLVVVNTFSERYSLLQTPPSTRLIYGQELRSDEFLFIGIAMLLTALVTLLAWQSLFPRLRDCLALAGYPASAGEVFAAKLGAVSMMFAGYVLALTAPWAVLFAMATAGPWQENPSALVNILATFAATAGACCFVFFILLALQGVLLNILPGRMFDTVSRWIQGGLFIAVMGFAPLVGRQPHENWWPGVWLLHLWEAIEKADVREALAGVGAIGAAASVAVLAYITSYHRHRRLLLEIPRSQATGISVSPLARAGAWLLEKWIPEPSGQAAFSFIWKTLTRSRGHRLALLAYAGLALGWIVKGAIDMPAPSLRDQGMYGMLVTIGPLAVALLLVIAFRYLFSLPVSPRAKWIFQLEDRNGSIAWLAATERFVIWLGIAPVFAASLPAAIAILGAGRALAVTALSFLTAVLWFEARFRKWRKLPFTCSFLPAKTSAAMMLLRYGLASYLLVGAGALILYCSTEPAAFIALITFQIALCWKLMRSRRASWQDATLLYEDLPEAEVNPLELGEFTNAGVAETPAVPAREALFTASLSESRGLLPESWAEEVEEERRHPQTFLTSLLEDVRFGLRLIRRNALVSAVVVLTLTAGIGINAAIFTIVNGMVLRPHIAKDPASFVTITAENRATLKWRASSYSEYLAYQQARSVRNLAAWVNVGRISFGDSDSGSAGLAVSCNFFAAEGVDRPRLGRLFAADDCHTPGQPAVAIISESIWRSRFASDPNIINRVIRLNNRPVPVVGVVAEGASGWVPGPAIGVWLPYTSMPWFYSSWNLFQHDEYFSLGIAGRVAPGFTRTAVKAELSNIAYQQDRLHPGRGTIIQTTDGSWIEWLELTMSGRSLLLTAFFFGAFNLVLFISCANVATLQLSRAAARSREIAVRLALGASRVRLMRMLVTESVLLAALAGVASALVAWKVPEPLCRYLTTRAPTYPLPPDWRVFGYIVIVALLTGVLSGVAPAIESLRADLNSPLKGSGAGWSGAGGTKRALGWLVSAQVAMSMVLLVGAGLLSQAERRNLRGNPGYDPQKVVVAPLNFGKDGSVASAQIRLNAITNRMLALAGVRSVAYSDNVPLFSPDTVELRPPQRPDAVEPVDIYTASPNFFQTVGIPLLAGREFRSDDGQVAIVSQALARAFWRRSSPLGQTITFPDGSRVLIIGIAKDTEPQRFGGSDNPALYRLRQVSATHNVLAVRFDYGAEKGARTVRAALRQIDPDLGGQEVELMQTWIDATTRELWNFVSLIVILGLVATVLSASGIYGAVSFIVGQSMKELGIRVALGATRAGIVRQVFVTGGKPVARGLVVGLWLSVAMAAVLRKTLGGAPLRIDSSDPLLYAAALLVLIVAATFAMGAPARRGAASDPMEALRCE